MSVDIPLDATMAPEVTATEKLSIPSDASVLGSDVVKTEPIVDFPEPRKTEANAASAELSYDVRSLYRPPKKVPKKQKTEKLPQPSPMNVDTGPLPIPSPESSITSSTIPSSRNRMQSNFMRSLNFGPMRRKDRSLIYVNYLNAFANSLTVHPPAKKSSSKSANSAAGTSKQSGDDESKGAVVQQQVDFEATNKLGSTTPYIADFDRDRCAHADSFCPFSKRDGYLYCEKHLLDDKFLPFVPCAYQRTESNPCPYPARMPPGAGGKNRPQRSKEALCTLHIEKCIQEVQNHMKSSANAVLRTMDGLAAYNVNPDKGLPPTTVTDMLDDLAEPPSRDNLETYLRATAKDTYATNSSSEESALDEQNVGLFAPKTFDTDDELDSEDDEPLKYCHSYSVEELARLLRNKLAKQRELLTLEVRLQEYKLKDARAKYLTEVAEEKTFLPSVSMQARQDPESQRAYRDLRTMMRVNRKRPKFPFQHIRKPPVKVRHGGKFPDSVTRCLHVDPLPNGKTEKCRMYSLPFSRHCLAHILEDGYQYLFKRCAANQPEQCHNAIIRSMGEKYCFMHTDWNKPRLGNSLDESQTIYTSSESEAEVAEIAVETNEKRSKKSGTHKKSARNSPAKNKRREEAENEAFHVDDVFAKLEQQENLHLDNGLPNGDDENFLPLNDSIVDVSMLDL